MKETENVKLIKYILPKGLTDYFTITSVKEDGEVLIIRLDEKNHKPPEHSEKRLESKGFFPATRIEDFPIREYKVYLSVRKRKWKDLSTGQIVSRDWSLTAKGTSYTKEFGAFLKEMARYSTG
jgi:hypothetical protein